MATSARLDELKKKFDENPRRYFAPLANEYRKQGDATQAIALCRTHLPNQPGHISGHIVLAQALYESRELAEARQIFEAALELDPENLIALRYLGDIAREQGSPAAAQAWYRRVLEFDPRNEEIAQLLADVRDDAEVAIADLASRPTPPSTDTAAFVAATADAVEPAEIVPAYPTLELEEPEAPVDANVASASEPIDFFDADPTGDAWRESMKTGEATPPAAMPAAEVASAEVEPLSDEVEASGMPELADPSLDDWFATAPAPTPVGSQQIVEAELSVDFGRAAAEIDIDDLAPADGAPYPDGEQGAPNEPETSDVGTTASTPEASLEVDEAPISGQAAGLLEMELPSWGVSSERATINDDALTVTPSISALDADLLSEEEPSESVIGAVHAAAIDDAAEVAEPTAEMPLPEGPAATDATWESGLGDANASDAPLHEESPMWSHDVADDVDADVVDVVDNAVIDAAFETEADAPTDDAMQEMTVAESEPETHSSPERSAWREPGPETAMPAGAWDDDLVIDSEAPPMHSVAEADAAADDGSGMTPAEMQASMIDPMIGRTPSFVPMIEDESPAPFVTETMAELYLQQGFGSEALSIYRQLLSQNPGDSQLAARVRALESGAEWSVAPDEPASPPSPGSESARAFFARFANREPRRAPEGNARESAGTAGPALTLPLAGAALPDEALTRPDEPALTQIFSGQGVDQADARAAKALASAFNPAPGAGGELSLERLFRDVPARSSGAVTLGEGGIAPSTEAAGASPDPAAAPGEAPADYEQFTAWLEGLKKK